jgi:ferritin-like protein
MTITTVEELRTHLQTAVEIEWSVIPPYLCARWSLEDGRNELAAECIDDVVMEEMLHLTLACNLLNAVRGRPRLIPPRGQPPSYPSYLPHSDDAFLVNLLPFSREALDTFLAIERPAPDAAPPEPDRYHTIAQFYEAVRDGVKRLGKDIFTGDRERQVDERYYYGGGGEAFAIGDVGSAITALEVIVDEGEGIHDSIWDGDREIFGQTRELAHYFRFDELHKGRRYVDGDTPSSGPTGEPLLVDFDAVLPMRPNPKAEDYPAGSELRAMTEECNATYSTLLAQLQAAFDGEPALLVAAVPTMLQLRYQAVALMHVPVGDGRTAGPAFQWRDSDD